MYIHVIAGVLASKRIWLFCRAIYVWLFLALECPAFSAENSLTSVLSRVVGGMAVSACAEGFGFEDGASVHSTSCLASAEWREPTAHCQRKPAQPQAYCIAAMPLLALYWCDVHVHKKSRFLDSILSFPHVYVAMRRVCTTLCLNITETFCPSTLEVENGECDVTLWRRAVNDVITCRCADGFRFSHGLQELELVCLSTGAWNFGQQTCTGENRHL